MHAMLRLVLFVALGVAAVLIVFESPSGHEAVGADSVPRDTDLSDLGEPGIYDWIVEQANQLWIVPGWMPVVGRDTDRAKAARALEHERQRRVALVDYSEEVKQLVDAKSELIAQLLSGELGLVEAAIGFMELDGSPGASKRKLMRAYFHGMTELESYCRRVLSEARTTLEDHSLPSAATLPRLRDELRMLQSATMVSLW